MQKEGQLKRVEHQHWTSDCVKLLGCKLWTNFVVKKNMILRLSKLSKDATLLEKYHGELFLTA